MSVQAIAIAESVSQSDGSDGSDGYDGDDHQIHVVDLQHKKSTKNRTWNAQVRSFLLTKMTTTTTDCSNKQPTAYAQLAIPLSTFGVSQDKAAATTTPETASLLTENNSGSQNNVSGQQPNINQNHHHHHYDPNEWVTEDTAARDRLIRALRYNFMSPKDRSMITHRFPGKLVLQIFKILVVSYQLYHFGSDVEQYKAADSSMVSFGFLLVIESHF